MNGFRAGLAYVLDLMSISRFVPLEKRKSIMRSLLPVIFMIAWFPVFSLMYSAMLKWLVNDLLQFSLHELTFLSLAVIASIVTIYVLKNSLKHTFINSFNDEEMNVEKLNN